MTSSAIDPVPGREALLWRRYCLAVLAAYLVLAYVFVFVQQPRFGPDEPRHFAVVKRLVEKHALPLLAEDDRGVRKADAREIDGAIVLHPPLYYFLTTPVYAVARAFGETAAYYAIKCLSPLLLFGALLLFLGTLRRLFPDRPFAAAAALTLVALLPEFQLEACVMNNDCLAILTGSLFFCMLVRTWNDPPSARDAALTGLVMAAFVNSKATGWTLVPLWAVALHLRTIRSPQHRKGYLRDLALGYGVLLCLGIWWYVRNYYLYGQAVPVPLDYGGGSTRPRDLRTGQVLSPLEVYTTGAVITYGWRAVQGIFMSFWTQVDWLSEDYQPLVYGVLLVLVAVAAAGGVRRLAALLKGREPAQKGSRALVAWLASPLTVLAAGFMFPLLSTWYIATFLHIGFYQGGRYLMPASFALASLLGAGWDAVIPRRWKLPVVISLAAAMLAFNALCLTRLVTTLNPIYVYHTRPGPPPR